MVSSKRFGCFLTDSRGRNKTLQIQWQPRVIEAMGAESED
jgi:hypothetical protein